MEGQQLSLFFRVVATAGFDHRADPFVELTAETERQTFVGNIPVKAMPEPQLTVILFDEFGQPFPAGWLAGFRNLVAGRFGYEVLIEGNSYDCGIAEEPAEFQVQPIDAGRNQRFDTVRKILGSFSVVQQFEKEQGIATGLFNERYQAVLQHGGVFRSGESEPIGGLGVEGLQIDGFTGVPCFALISPGLGLPGDTYEPGRLRDRIDEFA